MEHLGADWCFTDALRFPPSLRHWIPKATTGTVTTAAQRAQVSSSSVTKSHSVITLGTDRAHREMSPGRG